MTATDAPTLYLTVCLSTSTSTSILSRTEYRYNAQSARKMRLDRCRCRCRCRCAYTVLDCMYTTKQRIGDNFSQKVLSIRQYQNLRSKTKKGINLHGFMYIFQTKQEKSDLVT